MIVSTAASRAVPRSTASAIALVAESRVCADSLARSLMGSSLTRLLLRGRRMSAAAPVLIDVREHLVTTELDRVPITTAKVGARFCVAVSGIEQRRALRIRGLVKLLEISWRII